MSRSRSFAVAFPMAVAFKSPSAIFSPSRARLVIEVMFFGFPFFVRPMKDWYPTLGAAILGTVLYTELICRVAQDR